MDGTPPAQPSENPSLVQADPDPGRLAVIQIHNIRLRCKSGDGQENVNQSIGFQLDWTLGDTTFITALEREEGEWNSNKILIIPNYSPVFELRLVNPSLPEHLKCMGIFCLKFKSSNIEVPEESIGHSSEDIIKLEPDTLDFSLHFEYRILNPKIPDEGSDNGSILSSEENRPPLTQSMSEVAQQLNNLGNYLREQFKVYEKLEDLTSAIAVHEQAINLAPQNFPDIAIFLNDLAMTFNDSFCSVEEVTHLDKAILLMEQAQETLVLPKDQERLLMLMHNFGKLLTDRFDHSAELEDLNKAISVEEKLIKDSSEEHPDMVYWLYTIISLLVQRSDITAAVEDLDQAIKFQEKFMQLKQNEPLDKAMLLNDLARLLLAHFRVTGNMSDLSQSITLQEEAVDLTSTEDPDIVIWLSNLGISLSERFDQLGDIEDLNNTITIQEQAIDYIPEGYPNLSNLLTNLGNSLRARFMSLGNIEDLNKAIETQNMAVESGAADDPDMISWLGNLSICLSDRFDHLGNIDDLTQTIQIQEQAVALTPESDFKMTSRQNTLSLSLIERYKQKGNLEDLVRAIALLELVVKNTPEKHVNKAAYLSNLSIALSCQSEHMQDLDDLNKSIIIQEQAIQLTSENHPDMAFWLNNLSTSLGERYNQLGSLEDLNNAISIQEQAIQSTPKDHSLRASRLSNLSIFLSNRFARFGNLEDLQKSIKLQEEAIQSTPLTHTGHATYLNNLGISLYTLYETSKNINDLNYSITVHEQAVQATPAMHTDRTSNLNNLSISLRNRFERLKKIEDLDRALDIQEQVINVAPQYHPHLSTWLNTLGKIFVTRFNHFQNPNDLEKACKQFSKAATHLSGQIRVRFETAAFWGESIRYQDSSKAMEPYTLAMQLLPQVTSLIIPISDRYHQLLSVGQIVAEAVAIALGCNEFNFALEWLEQGQSVIWQQLLQLYTPLQELHEVRPDLALKLKDILKQLEVATTSKGQIAMRDLQGKGSPTPDQIASKYYSLAIERENLLKEIRNLKYFERFMQPMLYTEIYSKLKKNSPIILINIGQKHCDGLALIPEHPKPFHIPLDDFSYEKALEYEKQLREIVHYIYPIRSSNRGIKLVHERQEQDSEDVFKHILRQLWIEVVKPILLKMGYKTPSKDILHLTWCLNGPLAFLPVHAAGVYTKEAESSPTYSRLSDFAVSSYIPSLAAYIAASKPRITPNSKILTVTLPIESGLSHSISELENIRNIVGPAMLLQLREEHAHVEAVKEKIEECSFVHFACHGEQNASDPTESALLLSGGSKLTLNEVIKLKLPHAQLAFLSACQTATGAEKLPQEAVHLGAGMLLAGYQGVIATMWAIEDKDAPIIAKEFYSYLWRDGKPDAKEAAFALHSAVNILRDKSPSFKSWVPFIHMGI